MTQDLLERIEGGIATLTMNRPEARNALSREMMLALAEVNADLAHHEQLQMLVVAREPWSMEAGTLTPTMKIKRSLIEASVADAVDQWYATGAPVVWA